MSTIKTTNITHGSNSGTDGYGKDTPDNVGVCIYTVVEIYKEA